MKIARMLSVAVLSILLWSLFSCNGGGGDNGEAPPQPISLAVGEVKKVITVNSQTTMILETPTNQEAYLQVVYTSIPLPGTQPVSLRSVPSSKWLAQHRPEHTRNSWQDRRLFLDQYLRAEEERLVRQGFLLVQPGSVRPFNLLEVQVGDRETFFILNPETDQFVERTATARVVGTRSVFFVDETEGFISPAQIQQMFEDFEEIIYPRSVRFFGEESDVNGDGRITILVTSLLNGSGVAGFFRAADLFVRDASNPFSNEQEIFYVAFPTISLPLGLIQATIAHEFQHLLNFNQKVLQPLEQGITDPPVEELWLNEALSHLAEDLTGFSENGDDLANIVQSYLDQIQFFSVTGTDAFGGQDSLPRRAAGYLLLRYLFEQTGGAIYSQTNPASLTDNGGITFLRKLATSPQTGIENIRTTLREMRNPFQQGADPFREAFANWVIALAIDGTGLNNNVLFNYQTPERDQITGQLRGINLQGTREGRNGPITLQGPFVQPFSGQVGTLQGTSTAYILFQAPASGGNTATLTLRGNPESQLQLTVIRTE